MKMSKLGLLVVGMFVAACGSAGEGKSKDGDSDPNNGASEGNNSAQKKATGDGPCEAASECADDVCVALIDRDNPPVYCSEKCSSGSCPDGFYCDSSTFSLAGLSFCRFGATEPDEPEVPEEPPRLPCKTDADCEGDLVCAEFMGVRDCTITCAVDDDCTVSLNGVSTNFAECKADQAEDRDVCLPNPACYENPTSCFGGFPGF